MARQANHDLCQPFDRTGETARGQPAPRPRGIRHLRIRRNEDDVDSVHARRDLVVQLAAPERGGRRPVHDDDHRRRRGQCSASTVHARSRATPTGLASQTATIASASRAIACAVANATRRAAEVLQRADAVGDHQLVVRRKPIDHTNDFARADLRPTGRIRYPRNDVEPTARPCPTAAAAHRGRVPRPRSRCGCSARGRARGAARLPARGRRRRRAPPATRSPAPAGSRLQCARHRPDRRRRADGRLGVTGGCVAGGRDRRTLSAERNEGTHERVGSGVGLDRGIDLDGGKVRATRGLGEIVHAEHASPAARARRPRTPT